MAPRLTYPTYGDAKLVSAGLLLPHRIIKVTMRRKPRARQLRCRCAVSREVTTTPSLRCPGKPSGHVTLEMLEKAEDLSIRRRWNEGTAQRNRLLDMKLALESLGLTVEEP